MKRIVAMLLAMMLLFTSGGEILAAELADNNSNVTTKANEKILHTGLMEPEVNVLPESEMPEDVYDCKEILSINKYSAVYNHDWDKYSTNYYYNLLSAEEKELWDALDELCIYYLNNAVTIQLDSYTGEYLLETVKVPFAMTKAELTVFWQLFMYSNPQYYFLYNGYWMYGTSSAVTGIVLVCYDAFADGTARATATKKVQAQINEWENIIAEYTTNEEKLQVIYELICDKVYYNDDFVNGLIDEQSCFSQSAYSVFCTDTTVCAGYADAMTVMCNAIGLDAVSVTSYNHQWNKVRINDIWYNYDATWGDSDGGSNYYIYYARSDAFYASDSKSHVEEDFWIDYSPNAVIDVEPSGYYSPGTYPTIKLSPYAPSISFAKEESGWLVHFYSHTEGVTIYYTLDGTEPTPAATKSIKYTGTPILVDNSCMIKAIAVLDGYLDSEIQLMNLVENTYNITYVLNGGVNNSSNPKSFSEFAPEFELAPASRDGYTFGGWYYDSAFTKPVGKIKGNAGNITVYAKWDKIITSIDKAKVTLSETKYYYDGKAKKPSVKVTLNGKTLVKDTDYKVSYKNNQNIGTATVTITGINAYKGTIKKTFTISEKKGKTFTSGSNKYKVTSSSSVSFIGLKSSKTTKVKIPDTVTYGGKKFKVTSVANNALKGNTKMTTVAMGKNVKTIGVSAFEGCKKLSKVTLGSAVTTIDDKAFKSCTALKSITIPSKVTKIDKQAFYGCKNLKSIIIKSTKLKTVGKEALKKINTKATIQVPQSKLKNYKVLLKNKGQDGKVKIVKIK